MSEHKTVAQSILKAVIQQEYGLDPAVIPNEAARISSYLANGFRAATQELDLWQHTDSLENQILRIAAELEEISNA